MVYFISSWLSTYVADAFMFPEDVFSDPAPAFWEWCGFNPAPLDCVGFWFVLFAVATPVDCVFVAALRVFLVAFRPVKAGS